MTGGSAAGHANVAVVHDYLCARAGAERVAMAMTRAFPGSRLHTSLLDVDRSYPELARLDVRASPLNRIAALRRDHRRALPLLPLAFSTMRVRADVVVCSSAGWSHGVGSTGRKVVYWHSPPKWLYQRGRYRAASVRGAAAALAVLRPYLLRWDRHAVASVDRHLAISTFIQSQLRDVYGVEAEVVPPPQALEPDLEQQPVAGIQPGFVLCVCRLLPYKNVDAVVLAAANLPDQRVVIVGRGPQASRLQAMSPANVRILTGVSDAQLRWLYDRCAMVVTAAREDFGLTPLEGASFGKPAVTLRWGGFLDTIVEGRTGLYFEEPQPDAIAAAIQRAQAATWSASAIRDHAATYSEEAFADRLRRVVAEEACRS